MPLINWRGPKREPIPHESSSTPEDSELHDEIAFLSCCFAPSISTKFHCCTRQEIFPKLNQTLHFALFLLPTQPHWVNHLAVGFDNHIHHRSFLLLTALASQRLSAKESKQCLRPILDPNDLSREHTKISAPHYWKGPSWLQHHFLLFSLTEPKYQD